MRRPRREPHDLSGAYALDAVDEAERKRFERHLARCASCQREVRSLQEAASRFAVAVSARPPASLRTRVLGAVASDAQATPAAGAGEAQRTATGQEQANGPGARPRRAWESGWPAKVAIPLAAACLALAIVFGVLYAVSQGRLGSTRTQEDAIADVLSSPGARVIVRKTSIGGTVTVDDASAMRELVVTTDDMPGLPASEAYQVWVLKPGGKAASDGLLTRIPDRRTAPVLAAGLVRGDKVGLTVEPAGGTAKPTTPPIVDIPIAA
jgi:anti-sigma-K factor RskA